MMCLQDPLQRFLPRPYSFFVGPRSVRIESNDLELALAIRTACQHGNLDQVNEWTVLRDRKSDGRDNAITLVQEEALCTLLVGQGSMMVFDRNTQNLFAYVSPSLDLNFLTTALIPLLLAS